MLNFNILLSLLIFLFVSCSNKNTSSNLQRSIFLKCIDGKSIVFDYDNNTHVCDIQKFIQDKKGYNIDKQILTYGFQKLIPEKYIINYNLQNQSTLDLNLSLNGGDPDFEFVNLTIYGAHTEFVDTAPEYR